MEKITVKISDIKRYLNNGGSKNILAEYMGYETGQTISKWIVRKSVPRWAQKRVWEFLQKEVKNENQ